MTTITTDAVLQSPAAVLPAAVANQRELRLDLFRGIALWLIFIDHLPTNILTWFTIRNYGFSDATEIFIFISGYTQPSSMAARCASAVSSFPPRAFSSACGRSYVAHVFLFTIYLAEISYVATLQQSALHGLDFLKQPDVTIIRRCCCVSAL